MARTESGFEGSFSKNEVRRPEAELMFQSISAIHSPGDHVIASLVSVLYSVLRQTSQFSIFYIYEYNYVYEYNYKLIIDN